MRTLIGVTIGAALSITLVAAAQAQNCVTRPDGFGGSRMTCDDGTRGTTRPDGFGGSRTTIQPPQQPYQQPYGQQQQQPTNCTTRPDGFGGTRTTCR